jgi:exopolyphosphatase / guanosine-5'-triphosphate,3'-diphosphate pyrophosphatase
MGQGMDAARAASEPGAAEGPDRTGSAAADAPPGEAVPARETNGQEAGRDCRGDGAERSGAGPRSWRRRGTGPFYAALDLGTNNCRLLVAEPRGDSFRVVDSFSRIVRLGEGVSQTGSLGPQGMERAIGALAICKQKLSDRMLAGARLIATEACRRAANGAAFLSRVRDEIGMELEVIDRRTEAQLAVTGCVNLLDRQADGAVLFDIGGGSTEIVWVDRRSGRSRRGLVRAWVSIPIGVVTLAERHGGVEVDNALFERMVNDVRDQFVRFRARDALRSRMRDGRFHFLGTSGTVTTLAGVHLELPRYDRRSVDGLWMCDTDIDRMMQKLLAMDYQARIDNPCIGRERADLVLAGCAVFEAIRREWPCERLRVADRGLREGILVQLMRADGWLRGGRRRPAAGGAGAPQ